MRWVVLATMLGGCDFFLPRSCTEIGCSSGATVDVTDPTPLDQDIEVEARMGDETFRCQGSLEPENLDCDELELMVTEDGYTVSLPAGEETPGVHLTISRGGVRVFDDSVELGWEELQPNGEECGPTCIRGGAIIEVDPAA